MLLLTALSSACVILNDNHMLCYSVPLFKTKYTILDPGYTNLIISFLTLCYGKNRRRPSMALESVPMWQPYPIMILEFKSFLQGCGRRTKTRKDINKTNTQVLEMLTTENITRLPALLTIPSRFPTIIEPIGS